MRLLGSLVAVLVVTAPTASGEKPDPAVLPTIETRAACITHHGGDLPMSGAAAGSVPATPKNGCSPKELDGTVCDAFDDGDALRCFAREIAIWDGILDRLLPVVANSPRAAPVKNTIAAFRTFRDRSCTTYRIAAVNPGSAETVQACRLSETLRFTQKLYDTIYSP